MLRSPIEFKKAMLDAKHEYEVDMERAGWAPSPPIRDAAPAGARDRRGRIRRRSHRPRAGARRRPPHAAPVAAPPKADPDEVTRTLASLADLRDRGAITPEEYEAKKADLLVAALVGPAAARAGHRRGPLRYAGPP